MILDERGEFFDSIAIPAAGTAVLGDVIDLSVVRDVGAGEDVWIYASVDVVGAGGTSIQLNLITDDNAAMSSPAVLWSSPVYPLAGITAGRQLFAISLPVEGTPYERYLGIQSVVVGTFSTGQISAGTTLDPRLWKAYKDAIN